ncbi:DUF6262 family protein [Blautia sp.]|uniref:DUF6262 family protein n=1 Tax=Blautia sp. TaxID=1955243 RepID=UPI002590CFB4|nr:DUF6262 family protein [Blautia sp.]
MGRNKGLPKQLTEKQELMRQQSINKVLRAIEELKAEGRSVTITALVEFTGLSRSVFSKEHIRELLVDYGYSGIKTQEPKKITKKEKLADIVAEKDRKIQELRAEKEELERECELLRGRLFLLMQEKK